MDKNNTCDQCIDLRVAQVGEPDTTTEIVCREDPSAAGGGSTRTSGTCSGGGAGGAGTVGSSGALGLQNASSVAGGALEQAAVQGCRACVFERTW